MTRRPARISGVSLLAAAVVVLLPALAWLQYSWLDQIADADRERRARTLQTAASQLAQDFDGELGKAAFALQIDPSTVEDANWASYADKYQLWADSALAPAMVKAVYFVAAPDRSAPSKVGASPLLRVWNGQTSTFEETHWPEELAQVRTRFTHEGAAVFDVQLGMPPPGPRLGGGGERRGLQRMLFPPTPAGDSQTIVTPVVRVTPGKPSGMMASAAPDVRLLGYTVVRLDLSVLSTQVLPTLLRRHLYDNNGNTEFLIAVTSRDDPSQVIFESESRAAATASATPDETVSLLGARMGPFVFMSRGVDGRSGARVNVTRESQMNFPPPQPPAPPPGIASPHSDDKMVVNVIEARRAENVVTVQSRGLANEGHWRLVAKHRAGSLEAAVASARTRNFLLSSGILALLAAAIGLIVVSARRADRLARQQLEFVAAVSHELRTPVSVIGAAAGNLADGVVGEPDRVKRYGATIQHESRRLAETVERVLQLAGIAAGGAAATPTALSVPALVEDAVAATRHESAAAGVTVEIDIATEFRQPSDAEGARRVVGDATSLRSAIQNLVSNAIKYGGESRWVRVSAQPLAHRATRIIVEDRGLGISAEDRTHIFEPFYRGREAVSRQIQGSGLGLHLVQRIVHAHGGTVSVRSEPGRGSTFIIDLPGVHDVSTRGSVPFVGRVARPT